jgi:predicted nucleic acid-binding Zn ribbon protein
MNQLEEVLVDTEEDAQTKLERAINLINKQKKRKKTVIPVWMQITLMLATVC